MSKKDGKNTLRKSRVFDMPGIAVNVHAACCFKIQGALRWKLQMTLSLHRSDKNLGGLVRMCEMFIERTGCMQYGIV